MRFQFVISQKRFAISDISDFKFFYLNSRKIPIIQLKMDIDIINLNVNALFSKKFNQEF
jgi:hypothetical protein